MSARLVAMTFEEASAWIASQETRIRELEQRIERDQAMLVWWKKNVAVMDDRIAQLESALRRIIEADSSAAQVIARSALASK